MSLFDAFTINGKLELKNRIMMPPVVTRLATSEGHVTDALIDRYLLYAKGGASIVVTEAVSVKKQKSGQLLRLNDDEKTVTAMDLLVPGIGEIIGGSQREERYDVLLENFKHHNIDPEAYSWYADLRKFGTVPHAGFGLGFERLLMFVTGIQNIRDVIPFPRTPGNCEF